MLTTPAELNQWLPQIRRISIDAGQAILAIREGEVLVKFAPSGLLPLETGGAIVHASQQLGTEPFLLVNGDVWCDIELGDFIQHHHKYPDRHGHLLLVPNPDFHPRGDFALATDGTLLDTPNDITLPRFTFAGISLLKPELINHYPHKRQKFPLVEVFRHAISQGQLSGEVYNGRWSDVGTPERLYDLDTYLQHQKAGMVRDR